MTDVWQIWFEQQFIYNRVLPSSIPIGTSRTSFDTRRCPTTDLPHILEAENPYKGTITRDPVSHRINNLSSVLTVNQIPLSITNRWYLTQAISLTGDRRISCFVNGVRHYATTRWEWYRVKNVVQVEGQAPDGLGALLYKVYLVPGKTTETPPVVPAPVEPAHNIKVYLIHGKLITTPTIVQVPDRSIHVYLNPKATSGASDGSGAGGDCNCKVKIINWGNY